MIFEVGDLVILNANPPLWDEPMQTMVVWNCPNGCCIRVMLLEDKNGTKATDTIDLTNIRSAFAP